MCPPTRIMLYTDDAKKKKRRHGVFNNHYKKKFESPFNFRDGEVVGPPVPFSPSPFSKKKPQRNHTVAATMAPRSQNPDVSSKNRLFAALVLGRLVAAPVGSLSVVLASATVSLGNVPLSTIVFVPLTLPTLTNELFKLVRFPSPIIPSKKVELLASSHPHALYRSHKHVTGKVSLKLFLVRLRKLYGWL